MKEVAIVGAGLSGLAAAWKLSKSGARVVLYEKSRGVSGRAATRRREEYLYDHGANFFRTEDPEVAKLVHDTLSSTDLLEIPGEVWTFDRGGVVGPGDVVQNAVPKYSYRDGIKTLGKLLLLEAGATLRAGICISGLRHGDAGWDLLGAGGETLGSHDEVILSPPAPQAAEILMCSEMDSPLRMGIVEGLRSITYRPQFSFILGFKERIERPGAVHALVNSDGDHSVSWISFEEDKPGHVLAGESVLVAQMSPAWTRSHFEEPPEALLPEIMRQVRTLLPGVETQPDWWDSQRWRYAHPEAAMDPGVARLGESSGLHLCGDALAGRGRVTLAIKTGLECARRVITRGKDGEDGAAVSGCGQTDPA